MALTQQDTFNINSLLHGAALHACVVKSSYAFKHRLAYQTKNWLDTYKVDMAKFAAEVYMQHNVVSRAFEDQMKIVEEIGALVGASDMQTLLDTKEFLEARVKTKDKVEELNHP